MYGNKRRGLFSFKHGSDDLARYTTHIFLPPWREISFISNAIKWKLRIMFFYNMQITSFVFKCKVELVAIAVIFSKFFTFLQLLSISCLIFFLTSERDGWRIKFSPYSFSEHIILWKFSHNYLKFCVRDLVVSQRFGKEAINSFTSCNGKRYNFLMFFDFWIKLFTSD